MLSWSMRCLLFSSVLLLVAAQTVRACSCGPEPTILDALEYSDEVVILRAVFVERADNVAAHLDGVRSTTMVVEKVFKGKLKVGDQIVFGQGSGADCIWTFDYGSLGRQYLFYLKRPERLASLPFLPSKEAGLWFAITCGRSIGLPGANEDLRYLENMGKLRGKTRISGRFGGGWSNPDIPVEGRKIKIVGPKQTYELKTDKEGVFEIYDLPPGKYFVEPETMPGWKIDTYWFKRSPSVVRDTYGEPEMKLAKQVAIVLEPKKHASVDFVFTVDNTVRGRIIGPKGKPLSRVCVYLLRPEKEWGPGECTNTQGRFEITSIPEGEYVLAANVDGKLSPDEPFPTTFYPGVVERDRATVFNIRPGDTIENLDIVIPKLEETIILQGVFQYADGKPVRDTYIKFKITGTGGKVEGEISAKTDLLGRFSFPVLKGVNGELLGEEWLWKDTYLNCPKVDELIAKSGQNNVTVQTNIVKLTTEQDVYDIELTLPFPRCKKAKE